MERFEDHETSAVFQVIFSWICFNFENSCIHSDWKSPALFWGHNANVSLSGRISEIIHCEQTRLDNFYVFLWQAVRKMWAKIGIFDQPGKATPFPPLGPQFLKSIVCSLGYFNRDFFTSRSQIADYFWGHPFCPIKYYIYKEFLYILVSIQPFMFHNHFNNTMPIWVQYSTGVLMSHYHKSAVSVSFLARFCSNVYSIWWMWRVEGILPLLSTTKMHLLFSTGNCTLFHLLRSPFNTS